MFIPNIVESNKNNYLLLKNVVLIKVSIFKLNFIDVSDKNRNNNENQAYLSSGLFLFNSKYPNQ